MFEKKLCLIAPEHLDSTEFFGFHREAINDILFCGGNNVAEIFKVLNYKGLTREQAEQFFNGYMKDNPNLARTSDGKPYFDSRDLYLFNKYITTYVGAPLPYNKYLTNPVDNTVADYVVDFLVFARGWSKVQDRIYTSDPDCYKRFFDYSRKGYYIQLYSHELHFDYGQERFMAIDNALRERLYYEDKEICDRMADKLAGYRTVSYREKLVEDVQIKNRIKAYQEQQSPASQQPDDQEDILTK